uniref:ATP synthase membrane subunit 6 n=1 Tax=Trichuris sp. 2 ARS-2017 TaxID=2040584 RepID=A0A8F5DPQ3_9BILA|nr:ATP synthase membrane subunit 6 [Trichuris sp. 2 ARS-2017]
MLLSILIMLMLYYFWIDNPTKIMMVVSNGMYENMGMTTMDWSSSYIFLSILSLIMYPITYMYLPKRLNFNSRWSSFLVKTSGSNLSASHSSYLIVTSISFLIIINNMFSVLSFNWVPSTQYWFMLIITTLYLLSIWLTMIMYGGIKLFGYKMPMSWYMINFTIWMFHNLSFFIRFISLPFRMMMNLIVGCFLVEFVKSNSYMTSFISIYELFVITVQTIVFIILCNMYYVEMMVIPEWKLHKPDYSYLPSVKMAPLIKYLFYTSMKYTIKK